MNIQPDCPTLGTTPTAHHPMIATNKKPARNPGRFNIAVQYSDHDHHLVLVVPAEHTTAAQKVAGDWTA